MIGVGISGAGIDAVNVEKNKVWLATIDWSASAKGRRLDSLEDRTL